MAYLKLIRLKHWSKNLFIFIPGFFAGNAFDFDLYPIQFLGFISFSFIASAVYILNDYQDRETDRLHPEKQFRPLASGKANATVSFILMGILLLTGLSIAIYLNKFYFWILLTYLLVNIAYTVKLKNIPILDILLVATGFLFRIYAGGILINVGVSHWLAIMIFLLSLFLAIAKRRDDFVICKNGEVLRKSSRKYNLEFINACLSVFAGIIIVSYIMYTVSTEVSERWDTQWLFATTVFVIAGIMRYLQITFVEENSGSPTSVLFQDKFILITLFGWVISFYVIIYIV